jgi:hypothetical protein
MMKQIQADEVILDLTADCKSAALRGKWVRFPPSAPITRKLTANKKASFTSCTIKKSFLHNKIFNKENAQQQKIFLDKIKKRSLFNNL